MIEKKEKNPIHGDLLNLNEEDESPQVGYEEFKAMKRNKYSEKKDQFENSYVIQNKRTGKIVEIQAFNAILAAQTVGWRPRHTKVLKINKIKEAMKR